jgi:alanyl-tRNA synthetase
LVNKDNPQVIEIWNNVFMQFNRKADGSLEPLPAKHVDTGMGFERLCMALQGKKSNYDTDVFQPIIQAIGVICNCKYGDKKESDIAMRVIADHIRTIAFSITDGQLPSNAKAGYVIRRILRRAVRYGYTFLGQRAAFMYKLIPALIDTMGDAYPELIAQQQLVEKVMKEEEEAFLRTLDLGIRLLDKVMNDAKGCGKTEISGVDAFTLYDTYGFPLDLTELILRENGMTVNEEDFNKEMQKQKERARNAASIETSDWVTLREGESRFIGYDFTESDINILRYRKIKQKNTELFQVVFDQTPFYAEMGGQLGDAGYIESNGEKFEVIDTKKENNLTVHLMKKLPSDLTTSFFASIDKNKRQQTACNHTATHLLDYALREVLGNHVEQKGSFVSSDSLRFDFSHFQKVTDEELRKAENIANAMIRKNIPLEEFREISLEEARAKGAIALFGEKYGETVRVIKFGPSMELCGGTHVKSTGEIGMIKILSEGSVAAGVRRIEAISGEKVEAYMNLQQDILSEIKNFFNNTPNLVQAIKKTIDENVDLKKDVDAYKQEKLQQITDLVIKNAQETNGVKVVLLKGEHSTDAVKTIAFNVRNKIGDSPMAFFAATSQNGKPALTVAFSDSLVNEGYNAVKTVCEAAKEIQGGGGGQPFFAQAGGKNMNGLEKAFEILKNKIG